MITQLDGTIKFAQWQQGSANATNRNNKQLEMDNARMKITNKHAESRITARSVPVGNIGFFSEFVLDGATNAYIKSSFAATKKHYTAIDNAIHTATVASLDAPKQTRVIRTSITIQELLNPTK